MLITTSLVNAQDTRPVVVCIDPGHPSENGFGARGHGIDELDLVWKVSQRTAEILREWKPGIKIVLTKGALREKVTNRRRAEIANESGADLCLRVHADSGGRSGFATYFPDKQAEVAGVFGPSLEVVESSRTLAQPFHAAVMDVLKGHLPDLGAMPEQKTMIGGKQGALTGTVFSKVPVLLVELCAVDNDHDAQLARSDEGAETFAKALSNGVWVSLHLGPPRKF
jgi:N-acetylmuramoyl-L-alanine amidase